MRTAIVLLLLLAIAAVPGSMWPQRSSDPNGVVQYFRDNPGLAPVLDAMQFFDVYTSVWFSSIYLLLFVSLIGCVVPRTLHHLKALRAKPPKTPARLERLAGFTSQPAPAGTDAATAVEAARQVLRGAGYRAQLFDGKALSVSAERGYARETGNLVFHTALIGVLVAVGIGGGFGYAGQKVVVEGQTFVNVLGSYDSFNPGRFFTDTALAPYRLVLKKFTAVYEEKNLDAYGQAIDYRADVTAYRPQQQAQADAIKVNEPLSISGTNVYLLGNGYAPRITVRDGNGDVAYSGPVIFLPEDQATFTSFGVVKAPDARPQQIGLEGLFYPTYLTVDGNPTSVFGDDRNPRISMLAYVGDLGMDGGDPQSVYVLNKDNMKLLKQPDGKMFRVDLFKGQTVKLPNGAGSVTLDSVDPWVRVQISRTPGQGVALAGVVLALLGLLGSLFIRPRRVWVRARREEETGEGVTLVEVAGLDRSGGGDVSAELAQFVTALQGGSQEEKP
jgi:cytochrome c biogenesis protein